MNIAIKKPTTQENNKRIFHNFVNSLMCLMHTLIITKFGTQAMSVTKIPMIIYGIIAIARSPLSSLLKLLLSIAVNIHKTELQNNKVSTVITNETEMKDLYLPGICFNSSTILLTSSVDQHPQT